ncbi:ABC transporter ATP-binding protein [Lactiplantibacillus pentosus]|jgi:ABC-2 type transport system ATP-binding protein|uniref:ABC transporter, ATP-binding protein n=1 Tax=Lactiplantibacillus pentosus IG1 TaxID=1042160 RepID=G0LYR5_LACPE|nr:ABC transporter ATP-binding protein [Lactiplantibacillus pentosus]CCC17837.1 ABC transporter, ATP-binding protein [Lactiplantibacillus pentosus IG1]ASG80571.1 glycosyl transferase family 2 [Lactiplantibacillus pentosus]MCB5220764.1 ABC transporter ATP-binding protein [Lactiplantibacillus pentosus]MCT3282512.1 ABC transporter ATP-binding protein [Lactiplantibacillus pentosus]MCT3290046.1 ABC transporter ATP-binding protein [Lactiplantibacillus pentosus]
MTTNYVVAEQVSKSFGRQQVLNQIDLTLPSGMIYGLIGPSGAGKTTLIKSILGMEAVDSGTVDVMGTRMPNRAVMAQVGYMAQSDALYETLTARENLKFFGQLMSVPKQKLVQMIDYAAGLVDLTSQLDQRVSGYSGGMKRRLSLAIALIQDPRLLILDEPTVGIDPELRQQIWAELNKLKATGKSMLVTTHVMDEAERCDYLMLIRGGIALAQGTPHDLKQQYDVATIEQVFLKAGRMQDADNGNR